VAPLKMSRRLSVGHLDADIGIGAPKIQNLAYCDDNINSMQRSMCWVLMVAQAFGLCPVRGITRPRAEDLRL
jgi:hypothetical protein